MKKELILVGNKRPLRENISVEIDSFDYVMRVNRMNYLGKTAKNRLDGLFLEANTVFKEFYKGGEYKREIKQMKNILMHKDWYEKFEEWSEYLTKKQYLNIEIINQEYTLKDIGFNRPTSAVRLLAYLLNEEKWKDEYEVTITCLDVEQRAFLIDNHPNWSYHKGGGVFEQIYLTKLLKCGKIKRLYDE
ncbi:Uncharacterised protein [Capnocytophaga ochracea]|jgi:hypothetical protein|uniref:Uncharacterized protein n=1 Tax=Capnocytophaga ochracea TaxID=1018 RepID=A0A7Z8YCR8_CAPOC|nr:MULTISPECIES: hypothetical protein [Capnocytophaga]EIW93893.1 hypothetical protein HMPREF1321_0556 [Capnocytophaga sp. oral taxon 412 str. F0487]VDG81208.1 Uncharacterised protein [Capnocytophaga ochracea]